MVAAGAGTPTSWDTGGDILSEPLSHHLILETRECSLVRPVHRAPVWVLQAHVAEVLRQYFRVGLLRCSLFSKLWLVQRRESVLGSEAQVALKILDKASACVHMLHISASSGCGWTDDDEWCVVGWRVLYLHLPPCAWLGLFVEEKS